MIASLVAGRRQRRRMLRFYARFVRPGDLVFDVGANVGNRVDVFLALGASVVAVEPQPACVTELEERFGGDERFHLVAAALGSAAGEQELLVSDASTLSTMSPDWVTGTTASGRFAGFRWDERLVVPMTTLDALVERHGVPAFCKIDVEGFEPEVLRGLTRPLATLSFEFASEFLANADACVRRLEELGRCRFNLSLGEAMRLALPAWVSGGELLATLARVSDHLAFGDVYARFA